MSLIRTHNKVNLVQDLGGKNNKPYPPNNPKKTLGPIEGLEVSICLSNSKSWPSWIRYSTRKAAGNRTFRVRSASSSSASVAPGLKDARICGA